MHFLDAWLEVSPLVLARLLAPLGLLIASAFLPGLRVGQVTAIGVALTLPWLRELAAPPWVIGAWVLLWLLIGSWRPRDTEESARQPLARSSGVPERRGSATPTTSTTDMRIGEWVRVWLHPIAEPDARVVGTLACMAGLALVWLPHLWSGALGLELVAGAFWIWARAAQDRAEQLPRWTWLRRPALAMWLAAAAQAAQAEAVSHGNLPAALATLLVWAQALGVAWAGLELLAALPLARPVSDRSGPLPAVGPWLPALLPSAGFVILWRHVAHWTAVPEVRRVALFLLILTAVLATLRAFGRGRWVASLRWLIVA